MVFFRLSALVQMTQLFTFLGSVCVIMSTAPIWVFGFGGIFKSSLSGSGILLVDKCNFGSVPDKSLINRGEVLVPHSLGGFTCVAVIVALDITFLESSLLSLMFKSCLSWS